MTQQRAIVEQKKRDLNACTKNNVIHFTDGCGELFLQSVNTVEGDGQLNVNSRGYQVRDWNGQSYQPGPCTSANAKKMKGQTNVRFSAYKIKGKQYLKSVKAKWFSKPLVYLIILLIVFNTHRSSDYSLFVSGTRITLSLMNNNLPNIIITYIAICVSWEFGQLPMVGHHNSLLWRYFLFGSLI